MSTPYEREFIVTTTGSNQIVPLKYPGRCVIDRVAAVLLGNGAMTLTFYNRAFTGPLVNVAQILAYTSDASEFCLIEFASPFPVKVGDVITIASSAVSGYNTEHRITAIIDEKTVVTDQSWTADDIGSSATGQITIPDGEQSLYQFLTMTGSDAINNEPGANYTNLDPLPNLNIGVNQAIYVKFSATGTYKLVIRSHSSVGMGG